MNFDLYLPVRLITGRGCVGRNTGEFGKLGERCMIVTSGSAARKSGALDDVLAALKDVGVAHVLHSGVQQNPLLSDCCAAAETAREFGAQFIVGIGGGSALDAAKAVAVLAANPMDDPTDIYDYPKWVNPVLPLVLVSTTAGTGSEVAPFSVLTRPDNRKASISNEQLYATVSFGDAGYTDSLPYGFTVSTALDALSHAVEAYFSTTGNALSDLFAAQAVGVLVPELEGLKKLENSPIPADVRDRLYYASVLAGFALAKCGTCYPHTLGYFLSEEHGVAHGYACAATLPDFISRAARLMPEKAAGLAADTGCAIDRLTGAIEALTVLPQVSLSGSRIDEMVERSRESKNFMHTGPAGYTAEEARALLAGLYGEKR